MRILIINGPNINLLGLREPHIYGSTTYNDLVNQLTAYGQKLGLSLSFFQSNHEGDIVDRIQAALLNEEQKAEAIIINPAAYTHTSVAILDALKAVNLPTVEVHISNPKERETFRHHSFVSEYAEKTIMGEGIRGYNLAVDYILDKLLKQTKKSLT